MIRRFLPLTALAPFVAVATTLIPHTDAQRALASDRVAVVEVIERRTVSDPADARRLKTHTQLQVRENVRGTGPSSVTLVQLGGTVGQQSMLIPGDAAFAVGERALVFLSCPSPDRCYLVALGEGKIPIVDRETVVVHDMVTDEYARRPLRELIAELRAVLSPKAKCPGSAVVPEGGR